MTKKQKLIDDMREDFLCYVEEFLKIKDKDGNLIDFKLNRFQKTILESIIIKHVNALDIRTRPKI